MSSTPHFPIYMDYGATTPVDPRVVDAMVPWLREHFGNPSSRSHAWGWEAEEAVERARGQVAALIGADPREIVWTSGATESNNLALKGAAHFYSTRGKHLVTVKTEHKCVLDTMRELIAEERAKLSGQSDSVVTALTEYERLTLDRELAEKALASAFTSLEAARIEAQRQQLYLETIAQPNLADYPLYPKRAISFAVVVTSCLIVYGIAWLLVASAREHAAA